MHPLLRPFPRPGRGIPLGGITLLVGLLLASALLAGQAPQVAPAPQDAPAPQVAPPRPNRAEDGARQPATDRPFTETDNDLPYEESFGLSDAPFEGPANNGTIGIGGGSGGAFRQRMLRTRAGERPGLPDLGGIQ